MKKTMISIALIAVLGTMATGCQKETTDGVESLVSETQSNRTISYTVDGVPGQVVLHNEAEWNAFMSRMMTLAQEGYMVSITDGEKSANWRAAKETVVFRTPTQKEAEAWAKNMVEKGYTVEVAFDKVNGDFVCVAIRK